MSMLRTSLPVLEPTCCTPLTQEPLAEAEAAALAMRFKALADPVRLRLLSLVLACEDDEACVCDLTAAFALSQPTISHHLGILKKAGLVECEVRGRWCFYRARPEAINELAKVLEVKT